MSPGAPIHEDADEFRVHWQREFSARAQAYWTQERSDELARGKALLLPPAQAAPLLRAMGLLHRDAAMPPKQVRKYWQISHMVTLLGASVRELIRTEGTVRILDAGCGRSYLSMALAWVAEHRWGARLEILGVDRNPDIIAECRRRAHSAGLDLALRFHAATLTELDLASTWRSEFPLASSTAPHAVVSLHACDTATCDALALAVRVGASLIAVAPCCQAEVSKGWAALDRRGVRGPFRAIWATPHLRRETGADLTDAMRALLLSACGYQVKVIEFVPSEHTRKNTLLQAQRAVVAAADERASALAQYHALVDATGGVGLALAGQLPL